MYFEDRPHGNVRSYAGWIAKGTDQWVRSGRSMKPGGQSCRGGCP